MEDIKYVMVHPITTMVPSKTETTIRSGSAAPVPCAAAAVVAAAFQALNGYTMLQGMTVSSFQSQPIFGSGSGCCLMIGFLRVSLGLLYFPVALSGGVITFHSWKKRVIGHSSTMHKVKDPIQSPHKTL